jgi:hypothetical protein
MQMRSAAVALGLAMVASLAASAPASAQEAEGRISIEAFTLTGTQFGTPTGRPTLVPTDPLASPVTEGDDFRTSSIQCGPRVPFNDVGLDFSPDFPGVEDPASIRSIIEGEVTSVSKSGKGGTIEGTITSFRCVGGKETDKIVASFESDFRETSRSQEKLRGGTVQTTGGLMLTNGTFEIIEGTGTFDTLTGSGKVRGQFTCLPSTLKRNMAASCADLGAFSEGILRLDGKFSDPAPGPGGA